MTPNSGLILAAIVVVAVIAIYLATKLEFGCKHCPHCQQIKRDQLAEQERLAREYEARMGFRKDDDDRTL